MISDYTTYSDGELVRFLQNSDEKAFTELYCRYWDKLFYLAGRKLYDLYEAEHIVQDVFLDIWNRRTSLNINESVDGYLVVALKYRIINVQAKRGRQEQREKLVSLQTPKSENSTEEWIDFEELQSLLKVLVAKLPEKCGLVFSLRQDGLSYHEIANTMNISEKTVQMHLTRAFKSLRAALGSLFTLLLLLRQFL